jgi:hypothetical protein
VASPVNTGATPQTKGGDLTIGSGLTITAGGTAFALKANDGTHTGVQFVVGQDGEVGIGTTAPQSKLDVAGTARANSLSLTGTWSDFSMDAYSSSGWKYMNNDFANLMEENSTSGGFDFYTAASGTAGSAIIWGTPKMVIRNSGYVGVGTATPRNNFEVGNTTSNQTIRVGGIYRGTGSGFTGTGQETGRHQLVFSSWRDAVPDTIGAKIVAINKTAYGSPNWDLVQNTDLAFFTLGTTPSGADNTSEAMRITSGGYVGVGTATPGHKLDVAGDIGATAFYYTSDATLKKDIVTIDGGLEKINKLNGVYFKWKNNNEPSMGLIAQDVEKVFPEVVSVNPQTGLRSVDYGKLVAPLIEAVKDQQAEILDLKSQIKELQAKIGN